MRVGYMMLAWAHKDLEVLGYHPTKLNVESVKMAAHTYVKIAEDPQEDWLHPECLITTMPCADAQAWQKRLRNMDTAHRCADRLLLLDDQSYRS
jgi:hypothetical protein